MRVFSKEVYLECYPKERDNIPRWVELCDGVKVSNNKCMVGGYYYNIADIWTKEIPDAEEKLHWIPCSDRLPDIGTSILITTTRGEVTIASRIYLLFDTYEGILMTNEVVAWMPLPEPYEEVQK